MSGAAADLFSPVASALSAAVLNQLWQGALIGAITAAVLATMSRRSARARYAVACFALSAMLVAFVATFGLAVHSTLNAESQTSADAANVGIDVEAPRPIRPYPAAIDPLPAPLNWWTNVPDRRLRGSMVPLDSSWMAAIWFLGTALVALSSVRQVASVRRITANAHLGVRDGWRDAFETTTQRLGAEKLAQLWHSAAVEVPAVVGWLAPIILVPLLSCPTLSRDQMCAILAHELAHIRRHDYIVNIGQKLVEAVLFFHPVTWWLSRRIRVEREYCCDDIAIEYTDSALVYARALSQLDTLRTGRHDYAMGADGGSLMNRIARIVDAKPQARRLSLVGSALLGVFVAMIGMAFVVAGSANADSGTPTPTAAVTNPGPKAPAPAGGGTAPDGLVAAAHAALDQLVANGTINQSQATTLEGQVAAGRIDENELVNSGVVTDAQMHAVEDALLLVKQSFAEADNGASGQPADKNSTGTSAGCDRTPTKLAQAVSDGKMTQEQADQQLARGNCSEPAPGSGQPAVTSADCDQIATKLAHVVADGKMTQAQADEQLAGASCSAPATP